MKTVLGQVLNGRYLIIRQLEQKVSHTTYLAKDQHKLEQESCLIKQYKLSSLIKINNFQTNKNFKSFLFKAIQKNRQFDRYPQFATILDYFLWGEEFYLVRQFLVGKTLKEEIAYHQLEESEVINLLQKTLTILDIIHQEKELHLNLKPSNIIFTNSTEKIAIADLFPIQSLLQDKVDSLKIIATRYISDDYYLAPEQKVGKSQISSDFYALGIIAIQALTGKYLHEIKFCDLDNYARASIVEIETGKTINISSKLAKVLQNITNFNPEARFQSAQAILQSLNRSENMILLPSPYAFTVHYEMHEELSRKAKTRKKKQKKFKLLHILLIGLAILVLTISGFLLKQNFVINQYQNFAEYYNNNYDISLKYPQTWAVKELEDPITGEIAVFTSPLENKSDLFQEQIYLSIDRLSTTPEEYRQIILNKIESTSEITDISYKKESVKLDNESVYSISYLRKQGKINLQQKEFYTIKNDKVYLITYIAEKEQYQNFLKIVNQIIKSLTIDL
jgi:eukaryotic-like serine/threonine-protein kinase